MTLDEVTKLISSAKTKSCPLDPIPTHLVQQCSHELSPVFVSIFNGSLKEGAFPTYWKKALITPILKKKGLETSFSNYRPVSNLQFISKVLEKVVAKQLCSYLVSHNLLEPHQSAYRPGFSVETALLKVKSDILHHLDNRRCVLLLLLDLSAAFDTVDHQILLQRLSSSFGISGTVLDWLGSYLTGRSQSVILNGVESNECLLPWGVPQGSVLGPLLFTCYTSSLGAIARKFNVSFHSYADDTQLYISFQPGDSVSETAAVSRLEVCVHEIRHWMLQNKLKFNDSKTELLLLGKKPHLLKTTVSCIKVGESVISVSTSVRNLGFYMDPCLHMDHHVAHVCKTSWLYLKNILTIKKYLTRDDTQTLIHAFVSSRLDFCNSLLYGAPSCLIAQLQRVQNAAARIVEKSGKYEHISPILQSLHWLPVHSRIRFKVLLTVFKALHGKSAGYISNLISPYEPSRNLRSSTHNLLAVPRSNLVNCGDSSFQVCGPRLWNDLPAHIRAASSLDTFKIKLKTHLFAEYF